MSSYFSDQKGLKKTMSENQETVRSEWAIDKTTDIPCSNCRKNKNKSYGTLERRNVSEREGDRYFEYKVICLDCGRSTSVHRSKNLTLLEWNGMSDPEPVFKYENCK